MFAVNDVTITGVTIYGGIDLLDNGAVLSQIMLSLLKAQKKKKLELMTICRNESGTISMIS